MARAAPFAATALDVVVNVLEAIERQETGWNDVALERFATSKDVFFNRAMNFFLPPLTSRLQVAPFPPNSLSTNADDHGNFCERVCTFELPLCKIQRRGCELRSGRIKHTASPTTSIPKLDSYKAPRGRRVQWAETLQLNVNPCGSSTCSPYTPALHRKVSRKTLPVTRP